jgi:hypothetical protein
MLRPPPNHVPAWSAKGEFYLYPYTLCIYVVLITNTPEQVQQKKWINMAVTFHFVQCENTENHYFYTYFLHGA